MTNRDGGTGETSRRQRAEKEAGRRMGGMVKEVKRPTSNIQRPTSNEKQTGNLGGWERGNFQRTEDGRQRTEKEAGRRMGGMVKEVKRPTSNIQRPTSNEKQTGMGGAVFEGKVSRGRAADEEYE
jgi:Sec-independent protein translocase protein TatA